MLTDPNHHLKVLNRLIRRKLDWEEDLASLDILIKYLGIVGNLLFYLCIENILLLFYRFINCLATLTNVHHWAI